MAASSRKPSIFIFILLFIACNETTPVKTTTTIEFPKGFTEEFDAINTICHQTLNEVIIDLSNDENIHIIFSLSGLEEGTYAINSDYSFYSFFTDFSSNKFAATAVFDINDRKFYATSGDIVITEITAESMSGYYELLGYSRDSYDIQIYIKHGTISNVPIHKIQYGEISDYEENQYKTVKIGEQTWMAEDLRSTLYSDGTPITDFYLYPNGIFENQTNVYYTWNAANKINQDVCPSGWHVPTNEEWQTLIDYSDQLNESGDKKLKTKTGWGYIEYNAPPKVNYNTNSSGFTICPNGYVRGGDTYWTAKKYTGAYWTSEIEIAETDTFYLYRSFYQLGEYNSWPRTDDALEGRAVRCIKDQ